MATEVVDRGCKLQGGKVQGELGGARCEVGDGDGCEVREDISYLIT
jgi:hypothetical protein